MILAVWAGPQKRKEGGEGTARGGAELGQLLLQPSGTEVKLAAVPGAHSFREERERQERKEVETEKGRGRGRKGGRKGEREGGRE